jgi:uncharacterized protein (TIGR00255 family)
MTGYGSAALESESGRAAVSVRSLNHRYLDLSLHLARPLAPIEREIRALVESRLTRGRVELAVQAGAATGDTVAVGVSRPLVAGLVKAFREIRSEHGLSGEVGLAEVLRFPGAVEVGEAEWDEAHRKQVVELAARALDELQAMRVAEGVNLAEHLMRCLTQIEAAALRIEALAAAGKDERSQAIAERAKALAAELGLEEGRLYAEVVRLVDRSEVAEELHRLRSHVALARGLVQGAAPAGKRLDFLAQELMREANTLGSKAVSAEVVHEVVELKSQIEAFREQVQNVE